MDDLKRVSWLAIVFIVILRVSIGWQFLYEGMWKYDSMSSAKPWTAEGYLKNAQGPFRDHFRSMTGDPDDMNWLSYYQTSRNWFNWRNRFANHYELTDNQRAKLNRMVDGSTTASIDPEVVPPAPVNKQKLEALPESVNLDRYKSVVLYDDKAKELVVKQPVKPSEEAALKGMVDVQMVVVDGKKQYLTKAEKPQPADEVETAYFKAISRLIDLSRRLSYRHKLAATLKGDPELVGVMGELNKKGSYDITMGTVTAAEESAEKQNIRYGKIQEYKDLVEEYNQALEDAKMSFQYDHATMLGRKLAVLRSEVVGPVKAIDSELKEEAQKLLTTEQFAKGPPAPENTPLYQADQQAMWGLLIIGALLILGFFTRIAAIAGAVMLFMFYLVIPPWPGVPPAPGPEHSFIVNKNLIESIALLGIAAMPTGSWFGIDSLFSGYWRNKS